MVTGKTDSGFNFSIDIEKLDDMRFIEALAESETTDSPAASIKVLEFMLGKDQKEALYKHLEEENGRVPASKFKQEMEDIMQKAAAKKEEIKNL